MTRRWHGKVTLGARPSIRCVFNLDVAMIMGTVLFSAEIVVARPVVLSTCGVRWPKPGAGRKYPCFATSEAAGWPPIIWRRRMISRWFPGRLKSKTTDLVLGLWIRLVKPYNCMGRCLKNEVTGCLRLRSAPGSQRVPPRSLPDFPPESRVSTFGTVNFKEFVPAKPWTTTVLVRRQTCRRS